jgi:hypothetical protein
VKMQILFKNGSTITVDAEEISSERSILDGSISRLNWTTPTGWVAKLHRIELSQILAIVALRDIDQEATAPAEGARDNQQSDSVTEAAPVDQP